MLGVEKLSLRTHLTVRVYRASCIIRYMRHTRLKTVQSHAISDHLIFRNGAVPRIIFGFCGQSVVTTVTFLQLFECTSSGILKRSWVLKSRRSHAPRAFYTCEASQTGVLQENSLL